MFYSLMPQYLWSFSFPSWSYINHQKTRVNQHGEIAFFWIQTSDYWCYSIPFELCPIKLAAQYLFPNGCELIRWDSQSLAFFNPVLPVFLELSNRLLICSLLEIYASGTSSIFLGLVEYSYVWLPLGDCCHCCDSVDKALMILETWNHYFIHCYQSYYTDLEVQPQHFNYAWGRRRPKSSRCNSFELL